MKQLLLIILCGYATSGYTQQNRQSGDWIGNFAGQIRLAFHFADGSGGKFAGSFDSPDQGALGLPVTGVLKEDSIFVTLTTPQAAYSGKLVNDSTILGTWQQGAARLPLTFKRGVFKKPARPQTPVAPFPYKSEEVEYDNADKTVHFGATLTYPGSGGPFPTAILITGSGAQDRDETIEGHKPFAVIADHLTRNGYAVLRVDDRGMGKTRGPLKGLTSADFAKDVEAALAWLKTRKECNSAKTGLIGHSEGSFIAILTAVAQPADVHFIISLAGAGKNGAAFMADQNEAIWLKHGVAPATAAAYRNLYYGIASGITATSDSAGIYKNAWNVYLNWKKNQPAEVLTQLSLLDDSQSSLLIQALAEGLSYPWMKYMLLSDPASDIKKLSCKFLALNGSEDIQVVASKNLPSIEAALKESAVKVAEVKEIKGVNHFFQHCKTCTVQEYGQLEETFAPEVLDIMTNWLNQHVK